MYLLMDCATLTMYLGYYSFSTTFLFSQKIKSTTHGQGFLLGEILI